MSKQNQATNKQNSEQVQAKTANQEVQSLETAVTNPIPSLQRAYTDPRTLSAVEAQTLQRTIGNQALGRLIIQRKMTVGPVGDKYEQEADAVAKHVVSQLQTSSTQTAPAKTAQRQEEEEELQMKPLPTISSLQRQEEEEIQAKGDPMLTGGELSSNVESSVQNAKSGGTPLNDTIRKPMEQAFNADFSHIKIHTGSQADTLNRSLSARAFTSGQDVFFRQGEYNPSSTAGKELLAHELTHTVQQGGAPIKRQLKKDKNQSSVRLSTFSQRILQREVDTSMSPFMPDMEDIDDLDQQLLQSRMQLIQSEQQDFSSVMPKVPNDEVTPPPSPTAMSSGIGDETTSPPIPSTDSDSELDTASDALVAPVDLLASQTELMNLQGSSNPPAPEDVSTRQSVVISQDVQGILQSGSSETADTSDDSGQGLTDDARRIEQHVNSLPSVVENRRNSESQQDQPAQQRPTTPPPRPSQGIPQPQPPVVATRSRRMNSSQNQAAIMEMQRLAVGRRVDTIYAKTEGATVKQPKVISREDAEYIANLIKNRTTQMSRVTGTKVQMVASGMRRENVLIASAGNVGTSAGDVGSQVLDSAQQITDLSGKFGTGFTENSGVSVLGKTIIDQFFGGDSSGPGTKYTSTTVSGASDMVGGGAAYIGAMAEYVGLLKKMHGPEWEKMSPEEKLATATRLLGNFAGQLSAGYKTVAGGLDAAQKYQSGTATSVFSGGKLFSPDGVTQMAGTSSVKYVGDIAGVAASGLGTIADIFDGVHDFREWYKEGHQWSWESAGAATRSATKIAHGGAVTSREAVRVALQTKDVTAEAAKTAATVAAGVGLALSAIEAGRAAYLWNKFRNRRNQLKTDKNAIVQSAGSLPAVRAIEAILSALGKKIHRAMVNLVAGTVGVIAGICTLSGVGAIAGTALGALVGALRLIHVIYKGVRQWLRNVFARKHQDTAQTWESRQRDKLDVLENQSGIKAGAKRTKYKFILKTTTKKGFATSIEKMGETYKEWEARQKAKLTTTDQSIWARLRRQGKILFTPNWNKSSEAKAEDYEDAARIVMQMNNAAMYKSLGLNMTKISQKTEDERVLAVIGKLKSRG